MAINPLVPKAKKQNITKEKIQKLLPKGSSHKVTDEIIAMIDRMEDDIGLTQEYLEESLLSHIHILREVKVDLDDYINAIKYCNLTQHYTNKDAWMMVFPDRYKALEDRGRDPSSDIAMYNGRKIVTKIKALMATSISLQYAPEFHEAFMVQVRLMRGEDANGNKKVTPMVQHLAAKTVMEMAKPEDKPEAIETTVEKGSIIDEYEKAFGMAAMAKLKAIQDGVDIVEAINAPVRAEEEIQDAEIEEPLTKREAIKIEKEELKNISANETNDKYGDII